VLYEVFDRYFGQLSLGLHVIISMFILSFCFTVIIVIVPTLMMTCLSLEMMKEQAAIRLHS
jgi:hypothetical protein